MARPCEPPVYQPCVGLIPSRWSPFAIVYHQGRQSGRAYATPVGAFRTPTGFVLTPTYGPNADWARNVLALGSFALERRGSRVPLENARLVPRIDAWPEMPGSIRLAMRVPGVEWYVRADRPSMVA